MKARCPRCQKQTELKETNKYRPFCSERCSTLDLGAWADERYRVPVGGQDLDPVNENDDAAHATEHQSEEQSPPKERQN